MIAVRMIGAFVGAMLFGLTLHAAHAACRAPDAITDPPPVPAELTAPDTKGRDFEFYDQSYALIIGESEYLNKSKLADVPAEMKKLKAVLESQHFLVSLYLNLDSDNLEPVISCFVKSVTGLTNSRILVFYSGHGGSRTSGTRSVGYILPIDIPEATDDPTFIQKALPLSQFVQWAATLEVKHALFIFDSCFSGSILQTRGEKPQEFRPSSYVFSEPVQLPVRDFLTAGSANQEVPAQSMFLELLVQALLGQRPEADVNRDGFLTGTELASFLKGFVPTYNPNQTPSEGRINDPSLNLGEFVFQLPKTAGVMVSQEAPSTTSNPVDLNKPVLMPVFRGTVPAGDKSIAQIYEVEQILNTVTPGCSADCDPTSAQQYSMALNIPSELPLTAEFAEPELKCQGCERAFKIAMEPSLSPDRRRAEVVFDSWEASAVWQFAAKVLVPRTNEDVLVVDTTDNKVVPVHPNHISVVGEAPALKPDIAAGLKQTILDLQSENTPKRRQARRDLAKYVATDNDGRLVAQLVRGMTTGNYRYQLGIAEALAQAADGWKTSESTSKEILLAAKKKIKDITLHKSIDHALTNFRASVYYEVGPDGWLTAAGQLKPRDAKNPPLVGYASLESGTILQAASAVYMRAGPGVTSGVFDTLPTAACLRIIRREENTGTQSISGGWLQAVRTKC